MCFSRRIRAVSLYSAHYYFFFLPSSGNRLFTHISYKLAQLCFFFLLLLFFVDMEGVVMPGDVVYTGFQPLARTRWQLQQSDVLGV